MTFLDDDPMEDKAIIYILWTAVIRLLYDREPERISEADAVGLVHHNEDNTEACIIKFILEAGNCKEWGIIPIEPGKFKDGSILYYHDSMGDTVTYAALHGDVIADDPEGDQCS